MFNLVSGNYKVERKENKSIINYIFFLLHTHAHFFRVSLGFFYASFAANLKLTEVSK